MLGVDPRPLLDEARKKLELDPETLAEDIGIEVGKPLPRPPEPNGAGKNGGRDTADPNPPPSEPTEGNGLGEQVRVEETEHKPSKETERVRARVRATPSGQRPAAGSRRVTDAKLCQDLAYLFEEAEGQDRYPLRVDHLQGSDYFGCDLLSFDTPEERDKFKSATDERLVSRFIEVKGRGSEKGSIWLEGNERDSARKYHNRYYIYRVYQKTDEEFEVAVLNDPLSTSPKPAYEVNFFRATETTRYEVVTIRN